MVNPQALQTLAAARYVRLTTFKRDGTPVPTPVWLVRSGDHLMVTTSSTTGKVKRLRHTPRVLLVPSDGRGKPREGATEVEGSAELFSSPDELTQLRVLLKKRYGVLLAIASLVDRVRGKGDQVVGIRISV
jgi:PPOX class probable F420-dependent enzyme